MRLILNLSLNLVLLKMYTTSETSANICRVPRLSPRLSTFSATDLPLPSFSITVSTAGLQNWNHSSSSCYCWTSVWITWRQHASLAIVQDLVWGSILCQVSRHFNVCHCSLQSQEWSFRNWTGAEVDTLTSVPVLVCKSHWCTKWSVTLTLTDQLPNTEAGLRSLD